MPTIAIQDVLVPHREIVRDIEACRAIGIEPIRFGLIPFTDIISTDDPADLEVPAVPFGSVKLIRLWMEGKTPKGWRVFYDENKFDQRTWGPAIGHHALNDAKRSTELGMIQDERWRVPVFVKPANDLKAFAGMVVEAGETIRERLAKLTTDSSLSDEQPVIWAPRKEIEREFRCYMHGDVMIAASRYRSGLRADHAKADEYDLSRLRDFAGHLADRFVPSEFYAVDLAYMPDGTTKVVEYNCINCSGRYESDRGKLFQTMMGQ